jgi:spore maturation protein CgeB
VRVCRGWPDLAREIEAAGDADLVAKCSGVGGWDKELAEGVLKLKSPRTPVAYWDWTRLRRWPPLSRRRPSRAASALLIPQYDFILLYGGGPPVQEAYARLGARDAHLIYNAVDPDEYFPVPPRPGRACDLLFMGNRMPDREQRVRELFFGAAALAPDLSFVLGGEGWGDCAMPANVRWVGHVPTAEHRAWNCSARLVLNINRQAMADYGFGPPTRVFEAAGCACCVVTDAWAGIGEFFEPGKEILIAASAEDIAGHLRRVTSERAAAIGAAARRRVLRDHDYRARAALLESIVRKALLAAGHEVTVFDNLEPQVHGNGCSEWPAYLRSNLRRV